MELLKICILGCESIEVREDRDYKVPGHATVGPVTAKFKGRERMKDSFPPDFYTLELNGHGGVVEYCVRRRCPFQLLRLT